MKLKVYVAFVFSCLLFCCCSESIDIQSFQVISITTRKPLVAKEKVEMYFSFDSIHYEGKIHQRGSSSLSYPKKGYSLKLRKKIDNFDKHDNSRQKSKLTAYNKSWILDAMYADPLRLRSRISFLLWAEMSKMSERLYRSPCLNYYNVVLNEKNQGLYLLCEKPNCCQLHVDPSTGSIFKFNTESRFTMMADTTNNESDHDWEVLYPKKKSIKTRKKMVDFVSFVSSSSKANFKDSVSIFIDINCWVDYYLFVSLLGAKDNVGKNYLLYYEDESAPLRIAPWDMDATWGNMWGRIANESDMAQFDNLINSQKLFNRLLTENNEFNSLISIKWNHYRESIFHEDSLLSRFEEEFNYLKNSNAYVLESNIWNKIFTQEKINFENEFENTRRWIIDRLIYLDEKFSK